MECPLSSSMAWCFLVWVDDDPRGSSQSGADHRAATLYSVDPCGTWTMMQACASAAKLLGGGPILNRGSAAMFGVGTPPPRTVLGSLP